MRDPRGLLKFEDGVAVRRLILPLPADDFLRSSLAADWVRRNRLVEFEIAAADRVTARQLPFVTLPEEWTDLQAYDAAALTLELQNEAVASGFDMKDASAWNVIFDGAHPVFCDLLSFDRLALKNWWAAGQFARHFLLPLLLARDRDLRVGQAFRVWRDGVPSENARSLLGASRFLTRYWPLMAQGGTGAEVSEKASAIASDQDSIRAVQQFRERLHASFGWMLRGVRPGESRKSTWLDYESTRLHYADEALTAKRDAVDEWLRRLNPSWVCDMGCNAGEFSSIARRYGANVVSIDADHHSVQRFYRRLEGATGIHPVVAPLDDLCGGRGWAGDEYPGLPARLEDRFDVVLMLALIHHLMIGASVPVDQVARFVHRCTRSVAIVELIGTSDSQLQALCAQRQRNAAEFTMQMQRSAFVDAGFTIETELRLATADRSLLLLRKS